MIFLGLSVSAALSILFRPKGEVLWVFLNIPKLLEYNDTLVFLHI